MEFKEIFSFFSILIESIKLLHKNMKLMASISILSLLFPSIFFLLFTFSIQFLINHIPLNEPSYQNLVLYIIVVLVIQISFILVFLTISHFFGVATVLITATSYKGDILSSRDLFTIIKKKWKNPFTTSFHGSRQNTYYSLVLGILVAIAIVNPNYFTISIAIVLGIGAFIFSLYLAVVSIMALVVSIVEECSSRREAYEKAAEIVKGQRLHGFMINLFFNLLILIIFFGYWMIFGDKGMLNITIYGLFVVNIASLVKMFVLMAYTVLYFQCKKENGEEGAMLGKVQYTKLVNDIP